MDDLTIDTGAASPARPRTVVLGVRRCLDAARHFFADDDGPHRGACLKSVEDLRRDASSSLFAMTAVRQTIAEFFKHEYPELKWINGGLVTIDSSLHPGTSSFEWQEMGVAGEADFIADDATDIPRADVFGATNLGKAATIGTHFRWGRQEAATAQLMGNGINLVREKSAAARLLMDERQNRTIALGRPELGFAGMVNAPGMIVDAAITGNWLTATAAQIVADINAAWTAVTTGSNGVLDIDTAVLPQSRWGRLSTLQNSAASDLTVFEYLRRVFPSIKRWEWDVHMNTASPAGGPAVLFYKNSRAVQRALIPKSVEFIPEVQSGLGFKVIGWSRFAGVIAPQPRAMLLLTGV